MPLKVGDEVFVCNCGNGCPCNSMAMKESKCSCGNAMVKGKVVKLGKIRPLSRSTAASRLQYRRKVHLRMRRGMQLRGDQPDSRELRLRQANEAGKGQLGHSSILKKKGNRYSAVPLGST